MVKLGVAEQFDLIRALEDNWDDEGSRAFKPERLAALQSTVEHILAISNVPMPSIYPNFEDGVDLQWILAGERIVVVSEIGAETLSLITSECCHKTYEIRTEDEIRSLCSDLEKEIYESIAPRTLSREEVRELMRQGEVAGKELEDRFTRMERPGASDHLRAK